MTDWQPGLKIHDANPPSESELEQARLARLRPRDKTAAAIADAVSAVEGECARAASRLETAKARADQLLLTGALSDVKAARAAAERIQLELDQLLAMAAVLDVKLSKAKEAEAVAATDIAAAAARCEALVEKARVALSGKYQKAAAIISECLAAESEAQAAVDQLRNLVAAWPGVAAPPMPQMPRVESGPYVGRSFGHDANLPGTSVRPRSNAANAYVANG